MAVYYRQRWKVNALKETKAHCTNSGLSWMPPSDRTGGRGATGPALGSALPCPCLLHRACLLLPVLCGASCSFQVLCKNSVSDVTWREIEFSPIFLTIPNAIIFISRAFLKENASGGLSLAHLAEHGHVSELKRDGITYIFKGKFVCMCLDSDAKPTMFQFLLLYLFLPDLKSLSPGSL